MGLPVVVVAEPIEPGPRAWLAERAQVVEPPAGRGPGHGGGAAGFLSWLRGDGLAGSARGLVVRTASRVTDAWLAAMPGLIAVGRAGVGLDNIDVPACERRGVKVFNTPDANTSAVVELVLAMLLDAVRPRLFLDRALPAEQWEELRRELTAERGLSGRTLGVYGLGRIGSAVARVGAALGMRVVHHDLLPIASPFSEPVSREVLLSESDVISVHVDGRAENRHLLGADAFGRMRSEVVFINTSRGLVVDAYALADFMLGHPGACAMLDVHEPEPFGAAYPLLELANVHLSPHIASATREAKERMGWVVRDVWSAIEEKMLGGCSVM